MNRLRIKFCLIEIALSALSKLNKACEIITSEKYDEDLYYINMNVLDLKNKITKYSEKHYKR